MQADTAEFMEESGEQFEKFRKEGLLKALFQGIHDGCSAEFDQRHKQYEHPKLNRRAKGDNRWTTVDMQLLHIAPLFGFRERWIPIGIRNHPEMLLLEREEDNIVLSAHQLRALAHAPAPAIYRYERMPKPQDRLIFTEQEILEEFSAPLLKPNYWTLGYQQTRHRTPKWVGLGRPVRDRQHLAFVRDLGRELGYVHPSDVRIEFNPAAQAPAVKFNPPRREKLEGEGES